MSKQLTVEILKGLKWKFVLHLNMHKQHSMAYENKTWGLHYSRETSKRGYKILSKSMTAAKLKDTICDLMAEDLDAELEKFCEAYNG